jgi:hypothetical protein
MFFFLNFGVLNKFKGRFFSLYQICFVLEQWNGQNIVQFQMQFSEPQSPATPSSQNKQKGTNVDRLQECL